MSEVEARGQRGQVEAQGSGQGNGQGRSPRVVATPADLAAAREARGMSQIDVSQRIKLQVRQVAALEEGNWDLLPGRAFARGALRSYGKLIQVDVTPLLELIGATDSTVQLPRHALSSGVGPVTESVYERDGRGGTWIWVIGGLAAAVGLVYAFGAGPGSLFERATGTGATGSTTASASASTSASTPGATGRISAPGPADASMPSSSLPAASSAPASTASAPAALAPTATVAGSSTGASAPLSGTAPADDATGRPSMGGAAAATTSGVIGAAASNPTGSAAIGSAAAGSNPAGHTAAGSTAIGSTAAGSTAAGSTAAGSAVASAAPATATTAASASSTTTAPVAPGTIEFRPVEDSWVRVIDSTGRRVHEALIPGGTSVTVIGKPPYKLRMGNARHLQIRYDGSAVKLPPPNEKNITLLELP